MPTTALQAPVTTAQPTRKIPTSQFMHEWQMFEDIQPAAKPEQPAAAESPPPAPGSEYQFHLPANPREHLQSRHNNSGE